MRFLLFFLLFSGLLRAQKPFNATIIDEGTKAGISFASIGIKGKNVGTVANEKGGFELNISKCDEDDSLKISAIGYKTKGFTVTQIRQLGSKTITMEPIAVKLEEVVIKSTKVKRKVLGTSKYSTRNCSAFMGTDGNWKGEEAAIRANNEKGKYVFIENFNFYIIQNKYEDSLVFRLMLYSVTDKNLPGQTFLKKPIIFKTAIKQGVVNVDLKNYNITYNDDFFISLECLMDKMDQTKFCFAGSVKVPSYVKTSTFMNWYRVRGGGADLNVTVSYLK
jgi:hypothetical protein